MKLFGFEISRPDAAKQAQFEQVLMRLVAAQDGAWGGNYGAGFFGSGFGAIVTPENCMMSPTVHAIVTAVSRRISVSPIQVFKRVDLTPDTDEAAGKANRERKQRLPNHPVEKLLNMPNQWQSRVNYWQDATSRLLRYGNFYAYKSRGSTGPIREIIPLQPRQVQVEQDITTWRVTYRVNGNDLPAAKMHHVRGPSRNGIIGDSPVADVAQSIALEIAAEQFGASFFNNGALPLMVFKYMQGVAAFKSTDDEKAFIADFQSAFGGNKRHRALLLPKGIDAADPIRIENDKAQMLETRKYQRTVIAGAFGVPPHLVGDLERATFNNVEQQDADFVINVVMPITQCFEAAMERDLLTDSDRAQGVIIRFNLDAIQRADFKSRQEGLKVQREAGVICPNDWREHENMNPIPEEDGGEDYIRPLNYVVSGSEGDTGGGLAPAVRAPGDTPPADSRPAGNPGKALVAALRELSEKFDERPVALPPSITVNIPEQPAPVVHVGGPVVNAPVKVDNIVESPHVSVAAADPPELELVPVRGADGRVTAIRQRRVKE